MPRIHLIEKKGFIKALPNTGNEWESGFWAVPEDKANALVGGEVYFHKTQAETSFFGGRILELTVDTVAYPARIVFRFRFDKTFRGVYGGKGGWRMEKKVLF